jgi:hypothetical protein
MSWTTGTQTEALGVGSAVGVALANSTALSTTQSPATGAGYCPANFFLPSYGVSKSLLVKASGVLSTTATPNLTVAVVLNTTQGTPPAALSTGTSGVLATTGAVAQASSVTNVVWELDVVITNVTTGSSGTFLANGIMKVYTASTTIQSMRISSSTANPNTAATLSTQSAYYVELAALWGAASSSNSFQVYSYAVLGLN